MIIYASTRLRGFYKPRLRCLSCGPGRFRPGIREYDELGAGGSDLRRRGRGFPQRRGDTVQQRAAALLDFGLLTGDGFVLSWGRSLAGSSTERLASPREDIMASEVWGSPDEMGGYLPSCSAALRTADSRFPGSPECLAVNTSGSGGHQVLEKKALTWKAEAKGTHKQDLKEKDTSVRK